jgi:hypothetical protein
VGPFAIFARESQVLHYPLEPIAFYVVEEAFDVEEEYADFFLSSHGRLDIVHECESRVQGRGKSSSAEL